MANSPNLLRAEFGKGKLIDKLSYLLQTTRPKQWIKNLFVLAGVVFAGELFSWPIVQVSFATFFHFCLLSGAVYIYNDIMDIEQDKLHPRKQLRPIASGNLDLRSALLALILLLVISLAGLFLINYNVGLTGLGYFLLNVLYNHVLKKHVILDVLSISGGFVLRVAAGALAVEVEISPWLLLCTILISLFLGLGKRRYELVVLQQIAGDHRTSLSRYSIPLVDQMISIATSSTLLAYSLYTFLSGEKPYMMVTIPFVLYGIMRYLYLIYKNGGGGNPEELLLEDKPLLINVFLWGLTALIIIHFT